MYIILKNAILYTFIFYIENYTMHFLYCFFLFLEKLVLLKRKLDTRVSKLLANALSKLQVYDAC